MINKLAKVIARAARAERWSTELDEERPGHVVHRLDDIDRGVQYFITLEGDDTYSVVKANLDDGYPLDLWTCRPSLADAKDLVERDRT